MSTNTGNIETAEFLPRETNWWGAFSIGLAGSILVTGIVPFAVVAMGASAIPCIALVVVTGAIQCFLLAELATSMPERTGGLASYTTETFKPLPEGVRRHIGGLAGWSYWLGWFPVAPINMILAASYIVVLFKIPQGRSLSPLGTIGAPIFSTVLIFAMIAIVLIYIPCHFGIRLGATFATVMGLTAMIPLTLLVFLPFVKPHSIHWSNVAGFHLAPGVHGSPTFFFAWMFLMMWNMLAMEAAACYVGECKDPARDAKLAMTAEGLYGVFIYVATAVMFVAVLGASASSTDPLTFYDSFMGKIFGTGGWVRWVMGIPLILALMMSCLNAIMGTGRALYQVSQDRMMPRWFGRQNRHGVPGNAMIFNVVCACVVTLFGSPVRMYVFSNVGYMVALILGMVGYYMYRQFQPDKPRPFKMQEPWKYVSLLIAAFWLFTSTFGGWNVAKIVVSPTTGPTLYGLGIVIVLIYFPLYYWRRWSDSRSGREGGQVPVAAAGIEDTDLGANL